jgi:hypothetical protein
MCVLATVAAPFALFTPALARSRHDALCRRSRREPGALGEKPSRVNAAEAGA